MTPALYFLRSSEQKITNDMLYFAYGLDKLGKTLQEFPQLEIFSRHYGLSNRDLGLYALMGHTIAGAVWLRQLKKSDYANAYVDDETPVLNIAIKPEFRGIGVGSAMLEQLFLEAGALYKQISVSVLKNEALIGYFERFGFAKLENSDGRSPVGGAAVITMVKQISDKAVERPSDGYDPTRWMD